MAILTAENASSAPKSNNTDDFPAIPAGTYDARVVRFRYFQPTAKQHWMTQGGHYIKFAVKLDGGEYNNRWFFQDLEIDFSPGSRFTRWVKELIGVPLVDLDTDDVDENGDIVGWVDLPCRVQINHYFGQKDGIARNSVRDILKPEAQVHAATAPDSYGDVDDIF